MRLPQWKPCYEPPEGIYLPDPCGFGNSIHWSIYSARWNAGLLPDWFRVRTKQNIWGGGQKKL